MRKITKEIQASNVLITWLNDHFEHMSEEDRDVWNDVCASVDAKLVSEEILASKSFRECTQNLKVLVNSS